MKYTPEHISDLEGAEVFVFGSNKEGVHAGGAARFAFDRFGAVWGQGEGLQGSSYAIPTMGTLGELMDAIRRFQTFARLAPGMTFYVTPIGTGIAGIPAELIAPYFKGCSENVVLPREFAAVIEGEKA